MGLEYIPVYKRVTGNSTIKEGKYDWRKIKGFGRNHL